MADVQSLPHVLDSQYFPPKDASFTSFSQPMHSSLEQGKKVTAPAAPAWTPPISKWTPMCHPRVEEVAREVDEYFLQHWKFSTAKSEKVFLMAGFSRVTCLYFPLAKDDRIHFACRLLTVLFLIDDVLEGMSFAGGEAYNAKLIPISRGQVLPDRKIPAQYFGYHSLRSLYRWCSRRVYSL